MIALPLYKKTFEQGNSCFIDTETFQPIPDQFEFLKNINRITIAKLDELYQLVSTLTILDTSNPLTENKTPSATFNNKLTMSNYLDALCLLSHTYAFQPLLTIPPFTILHAACNANHAMPETPPCFADTTSAVLPLIVWSRAIRIRF